MRVNLINKAAVLSSPCFVGQANVMYLNEVTSYEYS